MSKQILTDSKMQELFGVNYKHILYYNFDTEQWNANKYQGFVLLNQDIDSAAARYMQQNLQAVKGFEDKEIVAVATMLVAQKHRGNGAIVSKPIFNAGGCSVVGTVVCRDRLTGQILPVSNKWIGGSNFVKHSSAVKYGAFAFCNSGGNEKSRALRVIHERQK
ncbi:MAG: hypothetical protein IKW57_00010 [Alphaproteobacteria bacterium]|nr:hypothetical protein [Alphaproteobacteria bacterium]